VARTKNGSEPVARAGNGDGVFLHRFEQRRLGLGGCTVDLVGQDDVGEDGAALKLEVAFPLRRLVDHIRPYDVGRHKVGGELDAREGQVERLGERPDKEGFPQPRDAFEQGVAAGEKAYQDALDHLFHPDDDLADFLAQLAEIFAEFLGSFCDIG